MMNRCTSKPCARRRSGFTLIELLVVIAIITVLAALLLPAARDARRRALLAFCSSNLHQIGVAMRMYVNDKEGMLPPLWHFPPPPGISYGFYQGLPRYPYSYWYHLVGFYAGDDQRKRGFGGIDLFSCPEVPSDHRGWGDINAYGYNYQFLTGGNPMVVSGTFRKLVNEEEIVKPNFTVSHCDAGYVSNEKYQSNPPEEWAPQSNNPGFGDLVFPGNTAWGGGYPGGSAPGQPVPMARHVGGLVDTLFFDGHVEALKASALIRPRRGDDDCLHDNN